MSYEQSRVPYGYCHCGCGQKTNIVPLNDASRGYVKGEPFRFIRGHGFVKRPIIQTFWSHVSPGDPEECWEWQASVTQAGYGEFKNGTKVLYAHRTSYELHFGSIPDEMQVLHRCDNRQCANPFHLFLGTNSDNMADKTAKNRQQRGKTVWSAKLDDDAARDIRALVADGVSPVFLAQEYGVRPQTICDVVNRRTWKHVP